MSNIQANSDSEQSHSDPILDTQKNTGEKTTAYDQLIKKLKNQEKDSSSEDYTVLDINCDKQSLAYHKSMYFESKSRAADKMKDYQLVGRHKSYFQ